MINNGYHLWEKYYTWNPSTCSHKNGRYGESLTDDSVIQ